MNLKQIYYFAGNRGQMEGQALVLLIEAMIVRVHFEKEPKWSQRKINYVKLSEKKTLTNCRQWWQQFSVQLRASRRADIHFSFERAHMIQKVTGHVYKGRCLSVKGDRRSSKRRNRRLHLANASSACWLSPDRMRGERLGRAKLKRNGWKVRCPLRAKLCSAAKKS